MGKIGPFTLNSAVAGDCVELAARLPDDSIDVLVTSPPYWGQRYVSTSLRQWPATFTESPGRTRTESPGRTRAA